MSLRVHWFIPSHGDGRDLAKTPGAEARHSARRRREPDIDYLTTVAKVADRLGFHAALVPFGMFCEDPFLVAAALARETSRLGLMVALRPGLLSPLLAAQMSATCQRLSGGRLSLNVVAGGDSDEQRRYGDWLDHDQRYDRSDEFLTVLRKAWTGQPFDFEGEHYSLRGAMLARPPSFRPELFLGGSSEAARRVAVRQVDVYLAWGETPARLGELRDKMRAAAAAGTRSAPRFGSRFHIIARDTAKQAWAEADELLHGMDPALIARTQQRFARSESHGQRRAAALHGAGSLEIYPNIWLGYGLVRPGAGTALVGSHQQVAERIEELHALGVEDLILSGQPHVEEAYWVGEGVLPLLHRRSILAPEAGTTRPG